MIGGQTLATVFAAAALVSGQTMQAPPGFVEICKGEKNIIPWRNVPHDWAWPFNKNNNQCCALKTVNDNTKVPVEPNCCDGDGSPVRRYSKKDWWYFGSDWQQRIANGDLESESVGSGACNQADTILGDVITFCDPDNDECPTEDDDGNPITIGDKCRKACAFEYTTGEDIRQRCSYFSFDEDTRQCLLFSTCNWPLTEDGLRGVSTANMVTHRIINIYPAGFKPFDLREFNEPPICIWVPGSGNKKVEVMIETEMNDASVCIRDGTDYGMGRNNVGSVTTCNDGKLEACFTAATAEVTNGNNNVVNNDFFFMIYCEGSCEATDIDLWLRIRTSNIDWNAGKTSTADDIEMWCEMEKGSTSLYENKACKDDDDSCEPLSRNDYTWPSDLLPKNPEKDPFNIKHTGWNGESSAPAVSVALFTLIVGLLPALF